MRVNFLFADSFSAKWNSDMVFYPVEDAVDAFMFLFPNCFVINSSIEINF